MRHAIINKDTKEVVNVVIWEGAEWLPPKNHYIVRSDVCQMGDIWNESTGEFTKEKQ